MLKYVSIVLNILANKSTTIKKGTLTNAIRSIDHKTIGIGKRGPVAEKIQSTFFDIVEAKIEDKYGWVTQL